MLENISNQELVAKLQTACDKEHEGLVSLLIYLGEMDKRKLYAKLGFSSLFSFCVEKLKYSQGSAYKRVACSRAIRDYPKALELLKEKKINISTLSIVCTVLSRDNEDQILTSLCEASKEDALRLKALYESKPREVRESIKPVIMPGKIKNDSQPNAPLFSFEADQSCNKEGVFPRGITLPGKVEVNGPESLDADVSFEIKFCISSTQKKKLEKVRSLMSFEQGSSLEGTLDALMDMYLAKKLRSTKASAPVKRKAQTTKKVSRYIRACVKREVYTRDQGRCTYVSPDGKRCSETRHLEYDHCFPHSLGGENDAQNIRLRCHIHNQLAAVDVFGKEFMEKFITKGTLGVSRLVL